MIPDRFILAGIVLRLVSLFCIDGWKQNWLDAVLGGLAVGGVLLAVVLLYEKLRKTEAMGGGDIKLLVMTGLWLGWKRNIVCLLFACVLGVACGLVSARRGSGQEDGERKLIPWGPSIAAAAIVTLLCGNEIVAAYLSLF